MKEEVKDRLTIAVQMFYTLLAAPALIVIYKPVPVGILGLCCFWSQKLIWEIE